MTEGSDQGVRRTLDKQEAIRHLIHTGIRLMIVKREDPFAVHLLAQSADKMLIDMAKARGQELHLDWEHHIKPEHRQEFFANHRAISNYFKHADKDFADDLPVRDIMRLNVITLFICVANYNELFGQITNHMVLLMAFAVTLLPELIDPIKAQDTPLASIADFGTMTPDEFFTMFAQNLSMFPKYAGEASKDREDIFDFYHLSFAELRAGITKSNRLIQIHDYGMPPPAGSLD